MCVIYIRDIIYMSVLYIASLIAQLVKNTIYIICYILYWGLPR